MNKVRDLIDWLNKCRDVYYNNNEMLISDKEYDELYDQLQKLEDKTGLIYPDSPTQSVGYIVQSELEKVKHDHPMLSLGKTREIDDLINFHANHVCVLMEKMDGLTVTLSYDADGKLVGAETRGDGSIGENVLENIKCISNIPQHISKGPYTIDGEVVMTYDTFNEILRQNPDKNYKHPRNVASGSLRQLDTRITKERNLKFVAWRVIDGSEETLMELQLLEAEQLGFTVVPFIVIANNYKEVFEAAISDLKTEAEILRYPIDGLVISYDDIEYGTSLGLTAHHPRHSLAYKFYSDEYETELLGIEWNTTRTGMISQTAIFNEVDLDGALTSRATLHNLTYIKDVLGHPYRGQKIYVARMNEVIPKVLHAEKDEAGDYPERFYIGIPDKCPCCGAPTEIRKDGVAEILYCTNDKCPSRLLAQFEHFCSKSGVNIDGLSEATLEKFIDLGFLKSIRDIYYLSDYAFDIEHLDGFGTKSKDKLLTAIEKSRDIKLENFLAAIGIKNIGKAAAKTISQYVNGDYNKFVELLESKFDFTTLSDFGSVANTSLYEWYQTFDKELAKEFRFIIEDTKVENNDFITGKTFVVTGAFNTMKRPELEKLITSKGGKLAGSVSKNTNYLLTNEQSGSTKYKKAMELNIPVMSEEEFLRRLAE